VIFSHVLYQLSYLGAEPRREGGAWQSGRGYRGKAFGVSTLAKANRNPGPRMPPPGTKCLGTHAGYGYASSSRLPVALASSSITGTA
jgi:hypothetical protein